MPADEPVLLLAFNRPDRLAQLIDRLRTVRPTRVFLAVDGPRADRPGDLEAVAATRALAGSIDWPCEVRTLFQESNLGCGLGVTTAISWFLEQVDRGIILEDDVLPQASFFGFCAELLERHADDPRVFAISGCNFVPPEHLGYHGDYRFSRIPHIWGWATWADRWQHYRLDISDWRKQLPLARLWQLNGRDLGGTVFWRSMFDLMARGRIDTWDMQVVYLCMRRDLLTATSNVNLVDNVGWGAQATHTFDRPSHLRPSEPIELPTAPMPVRVDERADAWSRRHVFGATTTGLVRQAARFARQRLRSSRTC